MRDEGGRMNKRLKYPFSSLKSPQSEYAPFKSYSSEYFRYSEASPAVGLRRSEFKSESFR
jgi:hypothetical protein